VDDVAFAGVAFVQQMPEKALDWGFFNCRARL